MGRPRRSRKAPLSVINGEIWYIPGSASTNYDYFARDVVRNARKDEPVSYEERDTSEDVKQSEPTKLQRDLTAQREREHEVDNLKIALGDTGELKFSFNRINFDVDMGGYSVNAIRGTEDNPEFQYRRGLTHKWKDTFKKVNVELD